MHKCLLKIDLIQECLPPYRLVEMYAGRIACCPLVNHGEYVDGTDRPIDASPLNYSFRSGRGQSNKID